MAHEFSCAIVSDRSGGGGGADYFSPDPAHVAGKDNFQLTHVFAADAAATNPAEPVGEHFFADFALRGAWPIGPRFRAAIPATSICDAAFWRSQENRLAGGHQRQHEAGKS